MTEIYVSLSDYVIAAECAIVVWLLASLNAAQLSIRSWFIVFYASIGLAAIAGGTVHGFFSDESTVPYRILWLSTLIALGITSLAGTRIASILQSADECSHWIEWTTYVLFACYCFVVVFVSDAFLVAIVGYLPMVLFLGFEFFTEYLRRRRRAMLLGCLGTALTLVAAAVQRLPDGTFVSWFENNVAYHTLQAVALLIIYFAAVDLSRSYQEKIHNS